MQKSVFSSSFTFCALILIVANPFQSVQAVTTLWNFRPLAGYIDTSPAVGDIDGDGVKDLIFCTSVGRVVAVNSAGKRIWYFDAQDPITNPPVLADVAGHQDLEVLVVTNSGKIICLNAQSGIKLWDYGLKAGVLWGMTSLCVSDLQSNGTLEIIAADREGYLVCIDGKGNQVWANKIKGQFNTSPVIADLNGDGQSEILFGNDRSPLICFSNKGREVWRTEGTSSGSSPLVCDLNGDQQPEILVGLREKLSAFDGQGKLLWQYAMKKPLHDGIAAGDVNNDGILEIAAVDLSGSLVFLSNKGQLQWSANVLERVRRSPVMGDIDGDFKTEVLVAGYSAQLYVFSEDGTLKEQIPLNGSMNAAPTIVDFKDDHRLQVICATNYAATTFEWMPAKPDFIPAVPFWEYRVNSKRTGTMIKSEKRVSALMTDIDYGNLFVGANEFIVTVNNPQKKRLKLDLQLTRNNTQPLKITTVSSDTTFTHRLSYTINGQSAENIAFAATLWQGNKKKAYREQSFYVIPFAKDMADLDRTLSAIGSKIAQLIESTYVSDRLQILSNRAAKVKERVQIAGTLSTLERSILRDQIAELRKEVTILSHMCQAAIDAGALLSAYAANPWTPFGGTDEILEGRTAPADFFIEAFPGETESAAFNLVNFSDQTMTVRVRPDVMISQADSQTVLADKILQFHEVLEVPTQALDVSADALPLLGQAQTLSIAPWQMRQLWITVNTSGLAPGIWTSKILLRSLDAESRQTYLNLKIQIWDNELPDKQDLRLCHWGYVHNSVLKDQPEAALNDQILHGTNVFVATHDFSPKASFDDQGDIIGKLDFSRHDAYVKQHAPHGIILFFNYQVSLKGPAEKFTAVWENAHVQWLSAWFQHLQEINIAYDNFALYPIDEPGLAEGLVDQYIKYAKIIRKVDPKVLIYTDPVAQASMQDLRNMAPYVDIWCPNRNGYLLNQGAEKLDFIRSTGKTVWTYECEGNAKHQSPLGYYRAQSWLVWHHGLTGIGFWSYCTSRYDPWYTPVGGNDYLLIYQGKGVVTSKRWEAVRDGIEDYSMLKVLQDAIGQIQNRNRQETINKAKILLDRKAKEIAQFCGLDEYGTLPGLGGIKELRRIEDARWQQIKSVRRQMADLLANLKNSQ